MTTEPHLASYLEASAERFPDNLAVQGPEGEKLTYRELDERSNRVAAFLRSRGVAPGDRVGLIVPKSCAAVVAIFGILKARAGYVPAEWTAPGERNLAIITDSALKVLFVDPRSLDAVTKANTAGAALPETVLIGASEQTKGTFSFDDTLAATGEAPPASERRLSDLAYVLYTSGSTGVPKGVVLTHENATSFVDWCSETFHPTPEDRFSNHAQFHFDLSVLDLYASIKHGASVHLIGDETSKWPKGLVQFLVERRITIWYSTPSVLTMMRGFGGLHKEKTDFTRLVLFAGEVFPVKHLRSVVAAMPDAAFYNLYGPTETNVCTFAAIPRTIPPERAAPYPIGPVCSHCHALVLDDENGVEVAQGEEGLLYISGPSVFSGYWNRPERNAAAFIERNGRRWYNTGDAVRWTAEDGYIYVGRRDRMVKRRGYRIELGEIERNLYDHPRVREAAVVSVQDTEGGVRIVAFLAYHPGEEPPSFMDLKQFCADHLVSYMSPDTFTNIDALPRTSTDKVDYQGLQRIARERK